MRYFLLVGLILSFATPVDASIAIVISNPPGAEVLIDGKAAGKTPLRKSLTEGKHELTLRKDGCQDLVQTIDVGKKVLVLRLKLKEKLYPIDIVFENINKDTMDWYIFTPDAKCIGRAPGTVNLSKGKHKLVLIKDGFEDIVVPMEIPGGESIILKDPTAGKSSWPKVSKARFLGSWLKPSSGSVVTFKADMTFQLTNQKHNGWGGKWRLLEGGKGVSIDFKDGGELVLSLQSDGTLSGVDKRRAPWQLKRIDK